MTVFLALVLFCTLAYYIDEWITKKKGEKENPH